MSKRKQLCSDFCHGLGLEHRRAYWAGERAPGPRERYLSQGRGLLSSMGTTMWALFPASEHMARRVSSFVLGSSCMLSRSMMPSTTSSIYRVEPEESQSFLLCFLPSSSLSTNCSNSRGLVAILSVTVQAECWGAGGQTSRGHKREF